MAREYFCAYHSILESLTPFGDAECGRLFRACLQYSMTGEAVELNGNERFLWPTLRQMIDRDRESYEERCRTNRENGRKGANAPERPRTVPNAPQEEEKEEEKEKDEDELTPLNPPRGTEYTQSFESFWSAYPKKTGKGAAFKSFQNAMKLTDLETILASLERHKRSQQWTRDNGQYIPMPATWLNQRRWEDEVEAPPERMKLAQGSSRSVEWRGDDGDLLEAMLG